MNERELARAEKKLEAAGVYTQAKSTPTSSSYLWLAGSGLIAAVVGGALVLGFAGAFVMVFVAGGAAVAGLKNPERPHRLRLQPEGIFDVTDANDVSLLPYADIDSVTLADEVVVVRVGERSLDVKLDDSSLVSVLHDYLETHVRAARELADERRVATEFLARVDAADYRHAGPPVSALEAIARAKGMPLALRVEAARAIDLPEDEIDVTEELKESKAMFED